MEEYYGSFGYGSRTCLGKNMGLIELSRVSRLHSYSKSLGKCSSLGKHEG